MINFKTKNICDNCTNDCEYCNTGNICKQHSSIVGTVYIENKEGGKTVGGDYCQPCFDKLIHSYLKGKIMTENIQFEKQLEAKQESLNQLEDRYTKLWNYAKELEEKIAKTLSNEQSMLFKIKFEQNKIMLLRNYKELFKKGN
jgi:hypothetical protein